MTNEERDERLKNFAEELDRLVNSYNDRDLVNAITEKLLHTHRTLQASIIRTFLLVIQNYSKYHKENPTWHDLRNEDAVNVAHTITEATNNQGIRFI